MDKYRVLELVKPLGPYNKLEPVLIAGSDKFAVEGVAEVPMDHKVQGKYGGVCRVLETHEESTLDLSPGDLVIIWDVAIVPFSLPRGAGELLLIKDADIFAKVPLEDAEEFSELLGISRD